MNETKTVKVKTTKPNHKLDTGIFIWRWIIIVISDTHILFEGY
jgi:hypothetical protein